MSITALRDGLAQIWIVDLPAADQPIDDAVLSADERERAMRFRRPDDRHRYRAAHVVLRELLAAHVGVRADGLAFARPHSGKPELPGSTLRFSLSKAADEVMVGLCRHVEIGVDIEATVNDRSRLDIARTQFSEDDVRWIEHAASGEQMQRFYRLWVAREALVKATGTGLSRPLDTISLSMANDELSLEGEPGWRLHESAPFAGYAAAAVTGESVDVEWRRRSFSDALLDTRRVRL